MADAWGGSWGSSWSDNWGAGAAIPAGQSDPGAGFKRTAADRQRRRARSLKRNLAYLEALDARTPVIERVVSKAIAREAVAKAEAVGVIPDDMPPQWVPNIVTVPVADVNDKALAVAAVIRELARRAADEEDIEMLLLAA